MAPPRRELRRIGELPIAHARRPQPLRHHSRNGHPRKNVDVGHEATIGRISDDTVFYLMSRGISEEEARTMVVNGFADPESKELPLEYAVEMNNLIKLEMEGAIG